MGTASTMACLTEALGMGLPGSAATPAVHADRLRIAEESGARAAALIGTDLSPSRIVTAASIENAVRVLLAIGGSTNAVHPSGRHRPPPRHQVRSQALQRTL